MGNSWDTVTCLHRPEATPEDASNSSHTPVPTHSCVPHCRCGSRIDMGGPSTWFARTSSGEVEFRQGRLKDQL